MKRLFFVLMCVVCFASCSNNSESEEISSPEEVSVTEIVTDTTTTVSTSTTVTTQTTTTQVTATIVTYPQDIDYIPENAAYKCSQYTYIQGERTLRSVTFYDENDKELRSVTFKGDTVDYNYTYDRNGNLINCQTIRQSPNDDIYVLNDEYEYDNNDRVKRVTHYRNNINSKYWETYEYDPNGWLIREDSWYEGQEDPKKSTVSEYDENGNVMIDKHYYNGDAESCEYSKYEYDENGRKITEFYKYTDDYSNTISYTYDDRGNLLTIDKQYGEFYNTTIYTYDEKNRCTSKKGIGKTGTVVVNLEYEYEELKK